jgi:hypothetical protein
LLWSSTTKHQSPKLNNDGDDGDDSDDSIERDGGDQRQPFTA